MPWRRTLQHCPFFVPGLHGIRRKQPIARRAIGTNGLAAQPRRGRTFLTPLHHEPEDIVLLSDIDAITVIDARRHENAKRDKRNPAEAKGNKRSKACPSALARHSRNC